MQTEITSVKFKNNPKSYSFLTNGVRVNSGDMIIVETARGIEFGSVVNPSFYLDVNGEEYDNLKPCIRRATSEDQLQNEKNIKNAQKAFKDAENLIANHKLEMKLLTAEYTFDASKLIFTFASDNRVDFRELVRDMAGYFRARIELRQVGARDEVKSLGGIGPCGRECCCNAFLNDFDKVSIKMAKIQGLALNPTKTNGLCGRLMCCLGYENETYAKALQEMPKVHSTVLTPEGEGMVVFNNLLKKICTVKLNNEDGSFHTTDFPLSDIKFSKGEATDDNFQDE